MPEIKEEILIVIPAQVVYDSPEAREAAVRELTRQHISVVSSQGYRVKRVRVGWELGKE